MAAGRTSIHSSELARLDCWDGSRGPCAPLRALAIPARTANLIANNAINASLLHRRDQALALARRALALAPDNSRAWSAWGYVLFGLHRLEQAATACERAMALGARDMFWAPPLAMVYAALGGPRMRLRRAQRIDGRRTRALQCDGFARLAAACRARSELRRIAYESPGARDAAYEEATLCSRRRARARLAYYERACVGRSVLSEAHAVWAHALQALGRLEEAPARFAVAVRVDSAYAPAYRGWGDALQALGRNDEARPLFERAEVVERRNREPLPMRSTPRRRSRKLG